MSNVLFGKLGQKIVYDRGLPDAIRSNTNGNYESYNILRMLSATLDNVFVVEDNILISFEQQLNDNSISLVTDFVPKIDCAFIILGVSEYNMSSKLLEIINSGIKWYALCSDPRCIDALTRFITCPPVDVYAGANGISCEIAGKTFITKYLNIEAANVYNEQPLSNFDCKHNKMIVVANQTSTWDRIADVKEMTGLLPKEDVIIYGRCEDKDKDERFGGEHTISFIYNAQRLSKVTYVAPIDDGWITAKYLECICRGVIPLMSTNYAASIPQFAKDIEKVEPRLFVKNPDDVFTMYSLVVNNKDYYEKTIYNLRSAVYNKYSPLVLRDSLISLI